MPVSGLLAAVNGVLTDMLQEQGPTSRKAVEDTIRPPQWLCCGCLAPTRLHIANFQPGHSQVTVRKKPPSQVRRDRKKAEKRQKARTDQASVLEPSDYSLSLSTPTHLLKRKEKRTTTLTVGLMENNSLTVHTLSVRQPHVEPGERVDDCFLQLPEPDPELNTTTPPAAVHVGDNRNRKDRPRRGSGRENSS